MTALAGYHVNVLPSVLCPACGTPRESLKCSLCGHEEAASDPIVIRQAEAKPSVDPPGYRRHVLESPVCKDCSVDLQIIGGELRCPTCGEPEERKPVQIVEAVEKPSLITADFLRCTHGDNPAKEDACTRDLVTDYLKKTSLFVCPICGDAKQPPVAPSRAVAAASALPLIGAVAGPVVQAAESAVRRARRR